MSFDYSIVGQTAHRPWPIPDRPWVLTQSWHDLLFAHWPVDRGVIRGLVPYEFDVDTFDGRAWLGVVPFTMTNVGPRGVRHMPWVSAFPELNVRTYVRVGDRPGVYFFSLDAARWIAVKAARTLFSLPYFHAAMQVASEGARIRYRSVRFGDVRAAFQAEYAPDGLPTRAQPGSIEYFLTERYCLYHHDRAGRPSRFEIHHRPWPLQTAHAEIELNTMAAASSITVAGPPVLVHFARRMDVVAWAPQVV